MAAAKTAPANEAPAKMPLASRAFACSPVAAPLFLRCIAGTRQPRSCCAPGGRWGSVVFARPSRVVFVLGFVLCLFYRLCVCNKSSHFRQKLTGRPKPRGQRKFSFSKITAFASPESTCEPAGACGLDRSPPRRRAALPHPKKENALLPAAMARGESGRSPTGAGAGAATGTGSPGSCATISATAPSGT